MHLFIAHIEGNLALLSPEESHHLSKVLRLKQGATVGITDGHGKLFSGEISRVHAKQSVIQIVKEVENKQKRPYHITLAVAPTKQNDRIEWFIEKAVEIGLDRYIPLESYHSERRKINKERWERLSVAAMKQSLKAELPQIDDLKKLDEILNQFQDFDGQKFIAHCDKDNAKISLKKALNPKDNYVFLIGPEGDFSQEEIERAKAAGFQSVSLGSQRLRTETAALSCVMNVYWVNA